MRARIRITDKIKEENSDGILDSAYFRYTEDDWVAQFKKDFKTIKSKDEVEFHYIQDYPFRESGKDKHFIDEDESNVTYGPMMVFGRLKLFKPFRKYFSLKPIMVGTCKFIGDEEDFEKEGEAPDGNHLAMVGNTLGTVKKIRLRQVLAPVKNQLGVKRFFIYKEMPSSTERLLKDEVDTFKKRPSKSKDEEWGDIRKAVEKLQTISETQIDKKEQQGKRLLALIDEWEEKNPGEVNRKSEKFLQLQKMEAAINKMEDKHDAYEEIVELSEQLDLVDSEEQLEIAKQIEQLIKDYEKQFGAISE